MTSLFALLISISAHGAEVSETFSTRAGYASGTAVWNQALGMVHPSLQVMNYKAGFTPLPFDVGDGSHGAFDVSTYANFSVGGDVSGNIIRLDLSAYPILKVTNFHLAAGWTIEPIGDQPLIIHSLTDVTIEGDILCQGADGTNAVGATPGTGGQGRCGGADGGNGGTTSGAGAGGGDIAGAVSPGEGGNFTGGAAVGGGGGGSWNTTSAAGDGSNSSVANGGLGGDSVSDPEFTGTLGGAGGGGGSGTAAAAGAGGGGGGGVVIIHAVRDFNLGTSPVSATGFIYAHGGAGGDSNVAGGPGGGGGGGGVKVFVGGTINIYNNDAGGASQAEGGAGGTNSMAVLGAAGAPGRSWFTSVAYNGIGFYTPAEELPVVPGNVEFSSASQYVITNAVDLLQSRAEVSALTLSPVSADFTFEAAGSDDGFVSDDTGWTTSLAALSGKRYLRLRISIATSNVNTPTMIDGASLTYTSNKIENFKLEAAGCGRVDKGAGTRGLLPLLFFLMYLSLHRKLRQN